MKKIDEIMLFAASACPMGRTMGTVLREVGERFPELSIVTYYIDIQIDLTNHYRIKHNPTTLFVDGDKKELYRIEGFMETEEIIPITEKIQANKLSIDVQKEENRESTETYVIYLYKEESLVPVEVKYNNLTSVKTPRITLIHQLLGTRIEELENPFPASASLELVQFQDRKGTITLNGIQETKGPQLSKMKNALEKSLESYGIKEVEIIFST